MSVIASREQDLNVLALVSDTLNVAFNAMALPCIHSCVWRGHLNIIICAKCCARIKMDC